jgi:hypothetical protein
VWGVVVVVVVGYLLAVVGLCTGSAGGFGLCLMGAVGLLDIGGVQVCVG